MLFAVHHLRWADLADRPAKLDLAPAKALATARFERGKGRERFAVAQDLQRDLVAAYGVWIIGWSWARSDGGPVASWCCAGHSVLPDTEDGVAPSVRRVTEAVAEWHGYLDRLEQEFEAVHTATHEMSLEEAAEHAAAHFLPLVIERTRTEDAWYRTYSMVMIWYFGAIGLEAEAVAEVVDRVVCGRFESWSEPAEAVARDTFAELGLEVATVEEPEPIDATDAWRRIRGGVFERPPAVAPGLGTETDAHLDFIERVDRARDPQRAERMRRALAACRRDARAGRRLSFDRLAHWQGIVLGEGKAPFRSGTAWAREGRVRYGFDQDTPRKFDKCLAEANDAEASVAVAGARAYLDVCFFHPFEDGNGRAARLVLDYVVTAAGLRLGAVSPLFVVARSACDRDGAWRFAYCVAQLLVRA